MAGIPTTTMRIDLKLKEQANEVFDDLGLNMSTAVNMFLKAVVREQGMPFNLHTGTDKDPQPAKSDEKCDNYCTKASITDSIPHDGQLARA